MVIQNTPILYKKKKKRLANMYRYIFKNKSKKLSLATYRKHTVTFMSILDI